MKNYECNRCEQIFAVDDAFEICTFKGSQEEPAEYDHLCPHCNSSDIEIVGAWCKNCGNVEVKYEEDSCEECRTCAADEWQQEREEMARMPSGRRFP